MPRAWKLAGSGSIQSSADGVVVAIRHHSTTIVNIFANIRVRIELAFMIAPLDILARRELATCDCELCYSGCSARIGSMWRARRAGPQHATKATVATIAT